MMKLLLVEDNPMNSDMLSRRLARRGYAVITVTDGEQALVTAQTGKFDVVLMDLSLPRLDGWEATRRLRSMPETRDMPVIALTAHALVGDYEKAINAGCNDYETKPINLERLVAKIERFNKLEKASGT